MGRDQESKEIDEYTQKQAEQQRSNRASVRKRKTENPQQSTRRENKENGGGTKRGSGQTTESQGTDAS